MALVVNFTNHLRKEYFQYHWYTFLENKTKVNTPNIIYETNITLVSKPDKDTLEKENYRPVSFLNKDRWINGI